MPWELQLPSLQQQQFIKKGLKEINVLILYPLISTIMLALCYFIQAPFICLVGGFVIGYAGAGGVLQLAVSTTAEFFPENKGTATSLVMIASSTANYTILSLGRIHYQSWRKQRSENDPSPEHGSDHRRYPARPLRKEKQKSVRQCANKLIS